MAAFMTKTKVLLLLLVLIICINFFYPSELNHLIQIGSIYSIFLLFLSLKIEELYLNKIFNIRISSLIIVLFILIALFLATAHGINISNSRDYIFLIVGYILIVSLIYSITIDEKTIWKSLHFFIFSSTVICIYSIMQYATDFFGLADSIKNNSLMDPLFRNTILLRLADKRVFGFFAFPTTLAAFLCIIIPLIIASIIRHKNLALRIISTIILIIHLATLVLTRSYGGIVTLALSVIIIGGFILFNRKKHRLKIASFLALILLLMIVSIGIYGKMRGGLIDSDNSKNPVTLRLLNWKACG